MASHVADFAAIALAVRSESMLSEQAVDFLRQVNAAEARRFLETRTRGGVNYQFMDGNGDRLRVAESRFVDDDLCTLCELSFLRLDHNDHGERIFIITRAGAKLASGN